MTIQRVAAKQGACIRAVVPSDAEIGRGARIIVHRGAEVNLSFGHGLKWGDYVYLELQSGSLSAGDDLHVRSNAKVVVGGRIALGDRVLVSFGTNLFCNRAITVGSDCMLSQHATIADTRHIMSGGGSRPRDHVTGDPIDIGEATWVSAGAVITPGVRVGSNCVIGANAVVTKDVPDWTLAVGIPAAPRPLPPSLDHRPSRFRTAEDGQSRTLRD